MALSEYCQHQLKWSKKDAFKTDVAIHLFNRESSYMRVKTPYMARGPGELTVPGGAMVFLFGKEDRDGMATVIYDGQVRGKRELKMHFKAEPSQLWIVMLLEMVFFLTNVRV